MTYDELEIFGERETDNGEHALERIFRVINPTQISEEIKLAK